MARRSKKSHSALNFLKFIITTAIIVLIVGVLSRQLISFLTHAELFKIRSVVIDPALKNLNIISPGLERLKGKNIFKVNLTVVQDDLRRQYPAIDQLRLMRHFPDKIYVMAPHREPFAFIDNRGRNIIIDRSGVVVAVALLPNLKLPVITGVKLTREAVVGRPLPEREVNAALNIIRAVRTNEDLRALSVISVDVSNLSSISFLLSNQMKIIIDDDKIYPKIRKLGILLTQSNIDLKEQGYIDLRFNEPVSGQDEKIIK